MPNLRYFKDIKDIKSNEALENTAEDIWESWIKKEGLTEEQVVVLYLINRINQLEMKLAENGI